MGFENLAAAKVDRRNIIIVMLVGIINFFLFVDPLDRDTLVIGILFLQFSKGFFSLDTIRTPGNIKKLYSNIIIK